MSRHFDSRDTGFDYQGQGYRRPEQYTAATTSASYPPPREAPVLPSGSLPPQGHPYYQVPPHSAPYAHQQPPAVYSGSGGGGGGYYPPHHPQWSEHAHPHPPPHYDPRQYPDHYGAPAHDYLPRGPPAQAGYSQYPPHLSGPFATGPFPSNYGPRTRRRPKEQARVACSNCKKDHVSCNNSRPCHRCLSANKPDECQDVPPKKRGRPRVRPDPYAATQSAAPANSSSVQEATSAKKKTITAWPGSDQAQLPLREEKETSRPSTKDATTSSTTSESRYPPSSWRTHFSTPDSGQTAAGASAPLSRSTTAAGPSPPSFARPDTANLSPVRPVLAAAGQESRATAPLTTPHVANGKPGLTLLPMTSAGPQLERPTTTGGAGPPPTPISPYASTRAAAAERGDYRDVPPPPPAHNPPLPSQLGLQGLGASRGPQLPPLSSLQSDARLSPERRPQADSTPVYDFSPTPRRRLSSRGHHANRYSWHEPPSQVSMLDRSPSRAGASPTRRRSLDARPVRDQAPPSIAGQRRPSESDHNDGQRKRQRLTLNEIMRND